MMTFEYLAKLDPKLYGMPEGFATDFWEELYKLFKSRMEQENANKQSVDGFDLPVKVLVKNQPDTSDYIAILGGECLSSQNLATCPVCGAVGTHNWNCSLNQ